LEGLLTDSGTFGGQRVPLLLGSYSQTNSNINYDKSGTPLAPYTTTASNFHYNEYEFYAQEVGGFDRT